MSFEQEAQLIGDYLVGQLGLQDIENLDEVDIPGYIKCAAALLVRKLIEDLQCNQLELAEILGCSSETISRWKLKKTRPASEKLYQMVQLSRKMDALPTREAREKYKYAMLLLARLQGRRQIKDPLTGKRYPVEQRPPVEFVLDSSLEHMVDIWEKAIQESARSVDETISEVLGDKGISLEEASIDIEKLYELLRQVDYEVQEEAEKIRRQKLRRRLPDLIGREVTSRKKKKRRA